MADTFLKTQVSLIHGRVDICMDDGYKQRLSEEERKTEDFALRLAKIEEMSPDGQKSYRYSRSALLK